MERCKLRAALLCDLSDSRSYTLKGSDGKVATTIDTGGMMYVSVYRDSWSNIDLIAAAMQTLTSRKMYFVLVILPKAQRYTAFRMGQKFGPILSKLRGVCENARWFSPKIAAKS